MTDRIRRNGLPSSCEPCRRSKLRCNHARPYFTRCVRRNISQQCYYHPSPMTRAPQSASQVDFATVPLVSVHAPTATSPPAETLPADVHDRGPGLVTMHNPLMPFADSNSTPFHRAFAYLTRTSVIAPKNAYPFTPTLISEGVEVLRSFLDFTSEYQEMGGNQYENDPGDLCGSLLFKAAWGAVQSTLCGLGARPSLDQLTSTFLSIFQQTARPLDLPTSAEKDTIELALSGPYLRWETIGMCCTMLMAFHISIQTRLFCDQADQTNDLTPWLLTSVLTLATWCFGDDSARAWGLMGDLASTVTALGYHNGFLCSRESEPQYLRELRKRVIALAHERDKELATFVGRPPRLSQRYCTVDLPLDLSDAILTGPAEQLRLLRLGPVHPVSRLRAIVLLSMIREEVLELSLGPLVPNITQKARRTLSKLTSTWESIPHKPDEQLMSNGPRLEDLYSKFLLYKLLISQHKGNCDKMVFYAMPCASVLILELYRQSGKPNQPATLDNSDIIQDIGALISCCDLLVISGQSNYQICKQAQMVFSQCLDQILNTPADASQGSGGHISEPEVQEPSYSLGLMDFGLTELYPQDPEWSTWLEYFELQET
ncbi:uncharacterized protein BO97DRAFT_438886 [Aspergillus homomorphus CBS 101889]|uniref:Zn(2)-C6 fungal-type domain-containing protein n=1 Tax=Aspergillus homomorphus (strain CBS 101889) TaxID=1450537 RepID=A0A395HH58_ASPHC|nr:hypothetical protein BO97DRAFT_438886 [Aspergillus homomorphus CBS 101889]RAL06829.1 hypothetical protein BO97DRAFT_438886 [Aspergillus homomorphus CBS 101889]